MKFKREPWGHQLTAIERARNLNHFGLFFEVGAGKTLTAINIALEKFEKEKRPLKTLIFGPPIVLENWKREWKMNSDFPQKNIHVLSGSGAKRVEKVKLHFHDKEAIFITNYEALLMKDLYELFLNWEPELIIWDELHKLKDRTSKRTKLAVPLADKAKYRLGLTGTPILNSLEDLFTQFRVLDCGERFGKNFFVFRSRYFFDKNAGMPQGRYFPDFRPRPDAVEKLNGLMADVSMVVKKESCMTLPPLVKQTFSAGMSAEQAKAYSEMKKGLVTYINDQACVASLAITKALRLQQIVSGFMKFDDGSIHRFKNNPRAELLKDLLKEYAENHKVIVWAVFSENYETIRGICEELNLGYVEVTGEVTASSKQPAVDAFNTDPKIRVFLGNARSAGIGINLVVSDISIFYSRNFSLEDDIQAEGRFNRGGSEIHQKLLRYDLVTENTIDEQVLAALYAKTQLSDSILLEIIRRNE